MRVLVVEDDDILATEANEVFTESEGYDVNHISSHETTVQDIQHFHYDAILVDLDLSTLEEFEPFSQSKNHHSKIPVLIIPTYKTGPGNESEDWRKALKLPEFKAILKSLICKRVSDNQNELKLGSLRFNTFENRAYINGNPLELSARETHVLELLIRHPNQILSKQRFLDHLCISHNAIEVYICRLRKKLAPHGIQVRVIRRVGYLIESHSNQ